MLALQEPLQLFELLHCLVLHVRIGDLQPNAVCGPAKFSREHLRQDPSHHRNNLRTRTILQLDHQNQKGTRLKAVKAPKMFGTFHLKLFWSPTKLNSQDKNQPADLDHDEFLLFRFLIGPVLSKAEVDLKGWGVRSFSFLEQDQP